MEQLALPVQDISARLLPTASNRRPLPVNEYLSEGREPSHSLVRLRSFQRTVRTLQLDHSESSWEYISWCVAVIFLILVPICKVAFVEAENDLPKRQLIFQPVVALIGVSRSLVSFVFLSQAIKRHGLKGLIFLDSLAEEVAQIRKDYDKVVERGANLLIRLSIPALILYIFQMAWLYSEVKLKPLPLHLDNALADLVIVLLATSLSWIYQTTTYLYACVLFWKVCCLQELKMIQYYDGLGQGLDAEYYVLEYDRIIKDLWQTSLRFRHFLAFTGVISVSGALISMHEVIASYAAGVSFSLWGELIVLTLVNLSGAWLCLISASKITRLHRRIVKKCTLVHAKTSLETVVQHIHFIGEHDSVALEKMEVYCQQQNAWARRDALVQFLSSNTVGISVYGYILDSYFFHTSLAALLTTTWFILGRALQV